MNPHLAQAQAEHEADQDYFNRKLAGLYLRAFQRTLAPFNLKRHRITIQNVHGEYHLTVDQVPYWKGILKPTPLLTAFQEIASIVEKFDNAPWLQHLEGLPLESPK